VRELIILKLLVGRGEEEPQIAGAVLMLRLAWTIADAFVGAIAYWCLANRRQP